MNSRRFAVAVLLMSCTLPLVAQKQPAKARNAQLDPQIVAALKDVSPVRIRATIEKLVSFKNRNTLGFANPQTDTGIAAARDWIKSEFESYSKECGGCLDVQVQTFTVPAGPRIPKPVDLSNVVATMKGTDPEQASRIFVVSGHFDSRDSTNEDTEGLAPGANDDGSGTAVSLECARVLSKHKFGATIIFITVSGEEQGLYGSAYFAKDAKDKGLNVEAMLNNDIVGGNKTPGDKLQDPTIVRVFSEGIPQSATPEQIRMIRGLGGESDSTSRQLARYIREVAAKYMANANFGPKLVFRLDRYLRGGDHSSFNQQGFAAVRFTEYREDYNHQHQNVRTENGIEYGDLPKFVDYDYVANVARLNAATLASLASSPTPPHDVKLVTKELTNDSTLTWTASPGATAYEVLWRPTTAAEWENVEPVGNVTQATLHRSKDNVIFAVRAVDQKGHRSLPIVPAPER